MSDVRKEIVHQVLIVIMQDLISLFFDYAENPLEVEAY